MYCPVCGTNLPASARFCAQCGHPLAAPMLESPASLELKQPSDESTQHGRTNLDDNLVSESITTIETPEQTELIEPEPLQEITKDISEPILIEESTAEF